MIKIPDQRPIIEAYGEQMQSVVAMEECSELIKAISKVIRYGDCGKQIIDLTEEIADVLICIEQLKVMYDISDDDIQKIVDEKCKRQLKRMNPPDMTLGDLLGNKPWEVD